MESKEKRKAIIIKIVVTIIIIACVVGLIYVFSSKPSQDENLDINQNDTDIVLPEDPELPGEPKENTIPKIGE